MVKKEDHNFTVGQTAESFRRILPDHFHVREEKSLRHGKKSLPEPDVVVGLGAFQRLPSGSPLRLRRSR